MTVIFPENQEIIDKMKKLQLHGLFESTSLENNPSPFNEDTTIKFSLDNSGVLKSIRIEGKSPSSEILWLEGDPVYSSEYIRLFGQRIFGSMNGETLSAINLFFLYLDLRQSWYKRRKAARMLVTDNSRLLEKRHKLESFVKTELNILTLAEAYCKLELIGKMNGIYTTNDSMARIDKGSYYYQSFKSKISHCNLPVQIDSMTSKKHILDALATRFTFLLLAIDELGLQFDYPKDTDMMIPYHFNYFLSLVTGIFDNLAITAKNTYNITLEFDYPSKISLSNTAGRDFLKELKKVNPTLRSHICANSQFIKLIHSLREIVVHREGFKMIGYIDPVKFVDFLRIDADVESLIIQCNDRVESGNRFSNWGIYKDALFTYLESYHFAMKVGEELAKFCDKYLEIIDAVPGKSSS